MLPGSAPRMVPVLLTFTAGAMDVTAFLALDGVFASVMTGNMVLLGLAGGTQDATLATATGLAFAGYAGGALAGARTAEVVGRRQPTGRAVLVVLVLEFAVLLAFGGGWLATAGDPATAVRRVLLVLAAAAMGLQSTAVKAIGAPNLSTTYMTGTLTGLLFSLATRHGDRPDAWATARLVALVAGAVVAGLVMRADPRFVPVVAWAAFLAALALLVLRRPTTLKTDVSHPVS